MSKKVAEIAAYPADTRAEPTSEQDRSLGVCVVSFERN